MKFSENLRTLRKEKDYSQEYLAEKLNVSRQTISKWENATAMPDLKKLTEIAELFEIGINELLGLDLPESENDESKSNIINVEYTSQKAEAQIAQLTESNKKIKTFAVINSICIILLAAMLVITGINLTATKNSLSDNTDMLFSQISGINSSPAINNDSNYDFTYEITSINKEKPWLVTVKFFYSPEKISKNADVYFSVTDYNGNDIKIEADNQNGNYVATKELDCRTDDNIYIYTDNGSEIEKQTSDFSLLGYYWTWNAEDIILNIDGSVIRSDQQLSWENVCGASLKSARIIFVDNGKVTEHSELKINKAQPNIWYPNINSRYDVIIEGTIKSPQTETSDIGIELIDENNVKYVHYLIENDIYYVDFGNGIKWG